MKTVFVPSIIHQSGRIEPLGEFLCMTDASRAAQAVINCRAEKSGFRVDVYDIPDREQLNEDQAAFNSKILAERLAAELRGSI